METNCISIGAKLEMKIEEYEKLKKDFAILEREKEYVEKKSAEKDQVFMKGAIDCENFERIVMTNLG
jgi:hypothetical protein